MNERAFWQQVYLAVIANRSSHQTALRCADAAVEEHRQRYNFFSSDRQTTPSGDGPNNTPDV